MADPLFEIFGLVLSDDKCKEKYMCVKSPISEFSPLTY
jgi:hypothetical protein